jgi:hypothetical protein
MYLRLQRVTYNFYCSKQNAKALKNHNLSLWKDIVSCIVLCILRTADLWVNSTNKTRALKRDLSVKPCQFVGAFNLAILQCWQPHCWEYNSNIQNCKRIHKTNVDNDSRH